jgi:hypothetical protein
MDHNNFNKKQKAQRQGDGTLPELANFADTKLHEPNGALFNIL